MKSIKKILSVVTPTLNNEKYIANFLESVNKQIKSSFDLEIIIVDGGSVDSTLKIAKLYKTRIVENPHVFADPGVDIGIKNAKGDLIIVLAVDNIFKDKKAFEKIVEVFEDEKIIAAFPVHASDENDSIFTKYINNFTDPFNHFVYGYASNGRTFKKIYKTLVSNKIYDLYDFTSHPDRPLIAVAQGFTIRSGFTRSRESKFDDVLPVIELVQKKEKIAFVHSVKLYHHTVRNFKHFTNKQIWATVNALQRKNYGIAHRINYLSSSQKIRFRIWPIYSLLLLPPFVRAFYHLVKDRDAMWIFHPFLCIISAYASLFGALIYVINNNAEFKRK